MPALQTDKPEDWPLEWLEGVMKLALKELESGEMSVEEGRRLWKWVGELSNAHHTRLHDPIHYAYSRPKMSNGSAAC